ncbi:MAG: glycosyltransferase [Nitrospira sp.]|nr:glycosyltransferase [Nitrospira sp.]MCW5787403.1 glycosyltransferase [Nitrospira sp.]
MAKRLLFLASGPPSTRQGGGAVRMLHLLRFLGSRFPVDVIVPAKDAAEEVSHPVKDVSVNVTTVPLQGPRLLDRFCRISPYSKDRALTSAVQERLASGAYAAIHVDTLSMMPYVPEDTVLPVVLDLRSPSLVSEFRRLRGGQRSAGRSNQLIRALMFRLFDRWCWPTTHCVTVASEEDRIRCERAHPGQRVLVVPNGVDCRTFLPKPDQVMRTPLLLFTGDMGAEHNIEAAVCLATEVFPAIRREFPKSELRLVGRHPDARVARLAGQGIVVTGSVADLHLHLREASIYVAPYVNGAGTRARLLEAMATGLPIITTSQGIEGMKVQPGRDVLVADQPGDMIESIQTLLASQPDRERFGQAARHMAEIWYDWSRCLWPLESLYQPLIAPRQSPPESTPMAC